MHRREISDDACRSMAHFYASAARLDHAGLGRAAKKRRRNMTRPRAVVDLRQSGHAWKSFGVNVLARPSTTIPAAQTARGLTRSATTCPDEGGAQRDRTRVTCRFSPARRYIVLQVVDIHPWPLSASNPPSRWQHKRVKEPIYGVGHHTEDDCRTEDAFVRVYRPLYEEAYAHRNEGLFDLRPLHIFLNRPSGREKRCRGSLGSSTQT